MNFVFELGFVPKVRIISISILIQNVISPTRRQAIIWTNDGYLTDALCFSRPQWTKVLFD